ncbi:MAG: hypothetical protein FWG03_09350 [Clostridiales bacterium]|nr:hypothetical protein [Clostridiales bacterium]
MSTDLDIWDDSLENRTDQTHTGLQFWQYYLFAPEEENQYAQAKEGAEAHLENLQVQPFSGALPEIPARREGPEIAQTLGILEKPPEYTQGLYNETEAQNGSAVLPVIIILAACVAAFFAARLLTIYQRRKADKCSSQQ